MAFAQHCDHVILMANPPISRSLPIRINLAHAARRWGQRIIGASPRLDATGELQSGMAVLQHNAARMIGDAAARFTDIVDLTPLEENRDPERIRIPKLGRTAWQRIRKIWAQRGRMLSQLGDKTLPLRVRFDILRAGRGFTDEEMITVRDDIRERSIIDSHILQAERARRRMINKLTDLNFCDASDRDGRRVIRREVELGYSKVSPLAYVFYVTRWPRGVRLLDLADKSVVTDLSAAVGHPVRSEIKSVGNAVVGLRFTVEIAASLGVPNLCKFSELLPMVPNTAPPLAFLVGYAEGKRLKWADLEKLPHMLGGGSTLGGKSNMMHVMVCSLVSRNTTDTLRLVMMDLKFQGIELSEYEGLPHLITDIPGVPNGIAVDEEASLAVLKWAVREAERRGAQFTRAHARNLREWNQRHPPEKRLPFVVIVCDELAKLRISASKEYKAATYVLLQQMLSQGRAAGISFVTFTQAGNREVLDELSKINLPGRICFSTPDAGESVRFVGDGSAMGLMPAGRAIFRHGTHKYLVQTPLIYPSDIRDVVTNARAGRLTTHITTHTVSPQEIIAWAIEFNEGALSSRDVVSHFNAELDMMEKHGLERMLKGMDGQKYELDDGSMYEVLPGIGVRPRQLKKVESGGNRAPASPEVRDGARDTSSGTWGSLRLCDHCKVEVLDVSATLCPHCGAPL